MKTSTLCVPTSALNTAQGPAQRAMPYSCARARARAPRGPPRRAAAASVSIYRQACFSACTAGWATAAFQFPSLRWTTTPSPTGAAASLFHVPQHDV